MVRYGYCHWCGCESSMVKQFRRHKWWQIEVDNRFCVGEPWGGVAVKEGIGFTHVASQDIWKNHPEKALVVNDGFASSKKEDLKKIMKAIIEASVWLDSLPNRKKAAEILSQTKYVNAPADVSSKTIGY